MRASKLGTILIAAAIAAVPAAHADPITDPLQLLQQQEAQQAAQRDSQRRYSDSANRARNLGRDSIGKGGRHMSHGRHHMNGGEINMGAFEIAQGLLGLLASQVADGMSGKDNQNAGNLDQITGGGDSGIASGTQYAASGPQADITSASSGSLGASGASGTADAGGGSASIDLTNLDKNPDTKQAMQELQDQFGISAKDLVGKLKNGEDPKSIFENAPQNALTRSEALAAFKSSREGIKDPKDPAPASVASAAPAATTAVTEGAPEKLARSGLRDSLTRSMGSEDDVDVSPEVKAALAARDAAERKRNQTVKSEEEMDLFDVVHRKYQEREDNLRWGKPLRTADGWGQD